MGHEGSNLKIIYNLTGTKEVQAMSNLKFEYKVSIIEHPGGLESGANVRVSFLFLEPLLSFLYIKKKKGSKKFDMKEKIFLKNRLEG